jgi:hypothetical protein
MIRDGVVRGDSAGRVIGLDAIAAPLAERGDLRRGLWVIFAVLWIGVAATVVIAVMRGDVERFDTAPDP